MMHALSRRPVESTRNDGNSADVRPGPADPVPAPRAHPSSSPRCSHAAATSSCTGKVRLRWFVDLADATVGVLAMAAVEQTDFLYRLLLI